MIGVGTYCTLGVDVVDVGTYCSSQAVVGIIDCGTEAVEAVDVMQLLLDWGSAGTRNFFNW